MNSLFADEASDHLFGIPIPLAQVFGLRGDAIGQDRACVRMPFKALHTNSRVEVHGADGTLLALATGAFKLAERDASDRAPSSLIQGS